MYPAFLENGDATWMKNMANALVGLGNMTVITVNWGDLSSAWIFEINTGLLGYRCVLQKNIPRAGTSIFYFYVLRSQWCVCRTLQTSMMNLFGKISERLLAFSY